MLEGLTLGVSSFLTFFYQQVIVPILSNQFLYFVVMFFVFFIAFIKVVGFVLGVHTSAVRAEKVRSLRRERSNDK